VCRRPWIDLQKPGTSLLRLEALQRGSEVAITRRELERVDKRTKMQAGTPANHRSSLRAGQPGENRSALSLELSDREIVFRFHQIDQVVTYLLLHGRRRFGCSNIETAVNLHRIDGDDLAVILPGDFYSYSGLARRGRADNGNGSQEITLPIR
jgi:hypothetical protein